MRDLIDMLTESTSPDVTNQFKIDVKDFGEFERVVHISDIHLGYEYSKSKVLSQFLDEKLPEINPDGLLITGDIFDFWRSSIEESIVNHNKHTSKLLEINDRDDIDVMVIPGNHDYRIKSLNRIPVYDEIVFINGDTKFRGLHGHQYDTKNYNDFINEALCLTSSDAGDSLSRLWQLYKYITPSVGPSRDQLGLPEVISPAGQLEHLNDPDTLAKPSSTNRLEQIENLVEARNDEFVLYGHTHVEMLSDKSANAGSFTAVKDEVPYIIIDNGDVSLNEYQGGAV
jgi:UDP-2,3-diacylglucosamine pyrophosphatase LpxH